jgi:hypothetical protein
MAIESRSEMGISTYSAPRTVILLHLIFIEAEFTCTHEAICKTLSLRSVVNAIASCDEAGRSRRALAGQQGDGHVQNRVAATKEILDRWLDNHIGWVAIDLDGTSARVGDIPVRDPHDEVARQHRIGGCATVKAGLQAYCRT